MIDSGDADAAIDQALRDSRRYLSRDNRPHYVLFVFNEPPPLGTYVHIEHEVKWPGRDPYSYTFGYTITEPQQYLTIINNSWIDGRGVTITYRARVKGLVIAQRAFESF